jgi:hypothetical protein
MLPLPSAMKDGIMRVIGSIKWTGAGWYSWILCAIVTGKHRTLCRVLNFQTISFNRSDWFQSILVNVCIGDIWRYRDSEVHSILADPIARFILKASCEFRTERQRYRQISAREKVECQIMTVILPSFSDLFRNIGSRACAIVRASGLFKIGFEIMGQTSRKFAMSCSSNVIILLPI